MMSEKKDTHTNANIDVQIVSLAEKITTPLFQVNENDNVLFFGEDNDFPEIITNLYKTVPMHSAIIDKKSNLILDGGLTDIKGNDLADPNKYENWGVLMQKIAIDIALYNESYLKIIWEAGGKKVAVIEHLTHDAMRLAKPVNGVINTIWQNKKYNSNMYKWGTFTELNNAHIVQYLVYNTIEKKKEQVLHIKGYNTITPYGLPDYFSAIKDLDTLAEISSFHNANIHQGMQPGMKFIFEGAVPPKEEKDRIIKTTKEKYAGAVNAGKAMFFFVPQGNKVIVEPVLLNEIDKMYSLLQRDVKENILVSHQIPRKIAGIETQGGLGSSKEVMELLELFKHTVIQPKQQLIINALQPILGIELKFKKTPTDILLSHTISDLTNVLTTDELRILLGFKPLTEKTNEPN